MIKNQRLYRQGEPADKIFIVNKGEVQLIRKMKRQASETNKGRLNERVFGTRRFKLEEWEKSRSPELKRALDVLPERATYVGKSQMEVPIPPDTKDLIIVGRGSMFGEEDAISLDGLYTTTAICNSLTGSVYSIKTLDFLTLKNTEVSWNKILSKSLWRETQKSQK